MKSVSDILKEHQDILENSPDTFFASIIKKVEKSIWSNIKSYLDDFTTKSGSFVNDIDNEDLLIELDEKIGEVYQKSGIKNSFNAYLKQFDRIEEIDKEFYEETLSR